MMTMLALVTTFSALACGDQATADTRTGYKKSPLERPGVRIQLEATTEMDRLGTPQLIPTPSSATEEGS